MGTKEKEDLDRILRLLYNGESEAWFKIYSDLNISKTDADHLFKIGKAFGYLEIVDKGSDEYPTDNHSVGITDRGIKFFALNAFRDLGTETNQPNLVNIFNSGAGAVITHGNNNHIVSAVNTKGNKEILQNTLSKSGIVKSDIEELLLVIEDEKIIDEKTFGPQVSSWIKKMINKCLDGGWEVSISAAGAILGDAISKFYGI